MPKKSCSHNWAPMKRGSKFEKCTLCGTTFPCRHVCQHLDCRLVKGKEIPAEAKQMLAKLGVAIDLSSIQHLLPKDRS